MEKERLPLEQITSEATRYDAGTTYKLSRFTTFTVEEQTNTLLLYNSFTGHRCAIPADKAARFLKYLETRATITAPLDELGAYFLRKGYIVVGELDEDSRWDVRYGVSHFDMSALQLTLLACEDCNFRCIYCAQDFKRGVMVEPVREGTKRLVESRIDNLSVLSISWFGGEPLLGYEVIADLQPYFQTLCSDHNVTLATMITSNAYLLTPDRAQDLVNWGVKHYQLTIDGGATEHDAHRRLPDGTGTFRQVYDNITAMRRIVGQFTVNIRVNFDNGNYPGLEKFFQQLAADFAGDSRFRLFFYPVGSWGGRYDFLLDLYDERAAQSIATELRGNAEHHGLTCVHGATYMEPGGNACYAALPNSYVIGADGKLMKCTVALDTLEDNVVGQLAQDGSAVMNEARLLKWIRPYYPTDAACQKCSLVPVCEGSSCPLNRVRGGRRPCLPAKSALRQTLVNLWKEDRNKGRHWSISVGSSGGSAAL
jgi:uncharacterized protein